MKSAITLIVRGYFPDHVFSHLIGGDEVDRKDMDARGLRDISPKSAWMFKKSLPSARRERETTMILPPGLL